jgi:alpha-tubulin suppressor-like RCC1 family protein
MSHGKIIKKLKRKLAKPASKNAGIRGYLLPIVIALGLGISTVSVLALQTISQNSATLNTQHYNTLAREAAQAGIIAANDCISAGKIDWDQGNGKPKLAPQTDCDGATVAGKQSSLTDDGNVQSAYLVKGLANPYGNSTRIISSTGTVTIKNSVGTTLSSFSETVLSFGTLNVTPSGGPFAEAATGINSDHACGVANGRAYCWGQNDAGQLGNNSTVASNVPVAVDTSGVLSGKTVTAITTGQKHTCAIASSQAYCWGLNTNGTLGNNTFTQSTVPVAVYTAGVLSGKTITKISAGPVDNCVIASDARAYCWGYGANGRLGNNSNALQVAPVAVYTAGVMSGKTVTDISAGDSSCAVASGSAYCWGVGAAGALGNGATSDSFVPVAVDTSGVLSGKTVTAVAPGCVVASGSPYCWGSNGQGHLGNGSPTSSFSYVPVAVTTSGVLNGKTVDEITSGTTGNGSVCVIAAGNAFCWGYNIKGQLGDGTTTTRLVPVAVNTAGVLNGKTVTSIGTGTYLTCAVADGNSYCWGISTYGQLGNGTTTNVASPLPTAVNVTGIPSGGGGGAATYTFTNQISF